jgi:predicted nuclease of predicted toxin-antitoxin system
LKLLLDENLSFRLVARLSPDFPASQHVDSAGLHARADAEIWAFARDNGFTIVSKDNDFCQLSLLYGAPPKVIWLSVGNATTETIARLLDNARSLIAAFDSNAEETLLVLELAPDTT